MLSHLVDSQLLLSLNLYLCVMSFPCVYCVGNVQGLFSLLSVTIPRM